MESAFIASLVASLLEISSAIDAEPEASLSPDQHLLRKAAAELEQFLFGPREAPGIRALSPPAISRGELISRIEHALSTMPGLENRAATTLIRLLGSSLPAILPGGSTLSETAVILRPLPGPSVGDTDREREISHPPREVLIREGGVEYPIEIAEISEVVVIPATESTTDAGLANKTPWAGPRVREHPKSAE